MSLTTILALLSAIETVIADAPRATALFNTVKTMLTSGAEPTAAQWTALAAMLSADHAALQAA